MSQNSTQVNVAEQYNLGIMYATGQGGKAQNMNMAKASFRIAAEQGFDRAQMNLASMYRQEGDMVNALKYYQMGADQGQRECMKNVGYFYYEGVGGVEKSHEKALEWYKKAAELGNSDAMLNLANMYDEGEGTEVDKEKALELHLRNARENNDPDSQFLAATMLASGTAGTNNLTMAVELCVQSIKNGHPGAHQLLSALQS